MMPRSFSEPEDHRKLALMHTLCPLELAGRREATASEPLLCGLGDELGQHHSDSHWAPSARPRFLDSKEKLADGSTTWAARKGAERAIFRPFRTGIEMSRGVSCLFGHAERLRKGFSGDEPQLLGRSQLLGQAHGVHRHPNGESHRAELADHPRETLGNHLGSLITSY